MYNIIKKLKLTHINTLYIKLEKKKDYIQLRIKFIIPHKYCVYWLVKSNTKSYINTHTIHIMTRHITSLYYTALRVLQNRYL